jgi:hypothetical protein
MDPGAVLWLVAALAWASILAVLAINPNSIDHDVARGSDERRDGEPSGLRVILECRPLLIFTASITLFHFANAAMLPILGEKLAQSNQGAETLFMAACIITAQLVMVPMAILVGHKADNWGRKPILLAGFAVLPIRGVLYTLTQHPYALVSIQVLDGVRRRDLRRAVLYRRGRFDEGDGALQPRARRGIGILGAGRRAQQFGRRFYRR